MRILNKLSLGFAVFIAIVLLSSCVAKKKLVDSENQRKSAEDKVELLSENLKSANGKITGLNMSVDKLSKEVAGLQDAKKMLEAKNASLQKEMNDYTSESLSQKQKMDAAMKKKLEELERREKVIQDLQMAIDQKDKAMQDVFAKIEKAMKQYSSNELTIELIDGKVYVAVSDKLLFKSGSAKVDARGKEALATLATVLTKHPELDIVVEGHTDNVPIKTDRFADNWDLSVIRATSVVRILTDEYGIGSKQATAAGKGEYFPKESNETTEGKAVNRRTEIIIAPNLDEIFKLLKK